MGIVIVLVGQQIQSPLSDDLIATNKCQGSILHANDTTVPSCFLPSSNASIPSHIKESTELYSSTHTVLLCLLLTVVNFLILVFCFWPKYKRVDSERKSNLEKSIIVK